MNPNHLRIGSLIVATVPHNIGKCCNC